ncbi:MAG: hypothetical protein GQ574_02895 [Crocinitomix sp.]|nr:hypothetical protein [Crocinitomix sp.]
MTTNNQENEAIELSAEETAKYQEMAKQELISLQEKSGTSDSESATLYPYGGTFTVAGAIYLALNSVTPMEFTNGVQLTFKGDGFGFVFGGGVFAGAGIFNMDPTTLPGKDVTFTLAAGPGIASPLLINWYYNDRPIGSFAGPGASAFGGAGGGKGRFMRL